MTKKTDEVPSPMELPKPSEIQLAEVARHMEFLDELRKGKAGKDNAAAPGDGEFDFPTLVLKAAGQELGDLLEIPVKRAVILAYMIGLQAGSEPFRVKSPV